MHSTDLHLLTFSDLRTLWFLEKSRYLVVLINNDSLSQWGHSLIMLANMGTWLVGKMLIYVHSENANFLNGKIR